MNVSRTLAYAVQAVSELVASEEAHPIPSKVIAARANVPPRYLLQILRRLVTCGILKSERGPTGGYFLTRSADEVTLLDLVDALADLEQGHGSKLTGISADVQDWLVSSADNTLAIMRKELTRETIASFVSRRSGDQAATSTLDDRRTE
jgi:Rrf2 family protein